MALNITKIERKFRNGNLVLSDPDSSMTPEEVMAYYSNQYPELTTSNVYGPTIEDDTAVYDFKTTVGTKG